jgi:hypothetical protein
MFCSDEIGADFVRNNLFTLWTHDCRGFLWWCANEQSHLAQAPYDWNAIERELGFFRLDGSPKPIVEEISRFTDFVLKFPYETLPPRLIDGVCILTKGQDTWGAAYTSFVLAKQAGLDIEFQYSSQPIKDAGFYLLPSINGDSCISRHRMNELLEKVKKGAVLYISADNTLLSSFREFSGVKVVTRYKYTTNDKVILTNGDDIVTLMLKGTYKCNLEVTNAEIIGIDQDGNPAFTCAKYGKGKVFFLNYPLETYLSNQPGVFHEYSANPYWVIYRYLKNSIPSDKFVTKNMPNIGITEHKLDENSRIVAVINYEPETLDVDLKIDDGWQVSEQLYGKSEFITIDTGETRVKIHNNDALIFTLKKL